MMDRLRLGHLDAEGRVAGAAAVEEQDSNARNWKRRAIIGALG